MRTINSFFRFLGWEWFVAVVVCGGLFAVCLFVCGVQRVLAGRVVCVFVWGEGVGECSLVCLWSDFFKQ